MHSALADFIEQHADTILAQAMTFARSIDITPALDDVALRDHLPGILERVVLDLRTPQSRADEIAKSEGRAEVAAGPRSAAGTHALHRAHSGYSISQLVSEYRALRASVLRLWADAPGRDAMPPSDVARFNEAIDEAVAESVRHYADEVERWRSIFLGVLGHDLRSPLGAILMTAEMIARRAVDAPLAEAAQRLVRSGTRMRELLDGLLVYNRAQIGAGFEIRRAEVDLARECREEIEMLLAAMPGARIAFRAPASLRGRFDGGRVREALANLVVNACKYGADGGRVLVELRDGEGGAELVVRNAGDPIAPETLALMFEPLRRGAVSAGESEHASLGLGLFIVKQIAIAHGGTVQAESRGGTTTFRLQLADA